MKYWALTMTAILAIAVPGWSANPVTNGGFESGDLTGWTVSPSGDPSVSVVGTPVYSGNYALEQSNALGGTYAYQQVTVPFGKWWRMKLWHQGDVWIGADPTGHTDPDLVPDSLKTYGHELAWTQWQTDAFQANSTKITIYLGHEAGVNGYFDDVLLVQLGTISVTVKDSVTALPIEGVTVVLSPGGITKTTADTGKCSFPQLEPGTYSIALTHWAYENANVNDIVVNEGATTSVNVQMTPKPAGSISGTVTASGGGNLGDAHVWLDEIPIETYTDTYGDYTLPVVPEGSYHLNVSKNGYVAQSRLVSVVANQNLDEDFVLVWRVIPGGNLLTNGDFETGDLTGWTEWTATHFSSHRDTWHDPGCEAAGYGDQWVVEGGAAYTYPAVQAGIGYGGTKGAEMGSYNPAAIPWGCCGGIRQQVYVEPGKYYRVSAKYKGEFTADLQYYQIGVGLTNDRFDPGVWEASDVPPPEFVDDVFKMQCGTPDATNMMRDTRITESDRWWHNLVVQRSTNYNGPTAGWDWRSTLDDPAPRSILAHCVRQATNDIMTVVLYVNFTQIYAPHNLLCDAVFDDVVLEEVDAPPTPSLGDLRSVDASRPYPEHPEIVPEIKVDLSAPESAKIVTGVFNYGEYYYIEEADRSGGVRVLKNTLGYDPVAKDLVNLTGTLATTTALDPYGQPIELGELVIMADQDSESSSSTVTDLPAPIGIGPSKASAKFRFVNPLVQVDLGNAGILGRVCGRVVGTLGVGLDQWVRIDDGAGKEFWLKGTPSAPSNGVMVAATGAIGIDLHPETIQPVMVLLIRPDSMNDDFEVIPEE